MVPNYPVSLAGVMESSEGKHIPYSGQFRLTPSFRAGGHLELETMDFPLKQELLPLAQSWNAVALG